jgi:hypothetical protein
MRRLVPLLHRRFSTGGLVHDFALRAALDAMSARPPAYHPAVAPLLPDVEVDVQTWKSLVVRV